MSKGQFLFVLMLLLIVALLLAWIAFRPAPRWEYIVTTVEDVSLAIEMKALGSARWELVFARRALAEDNQSRVQYEMIFKRPKRPQ